MPLNKTNYNPTNDEVITYEEPQATTDENISGSGCRNDEEFNAPNNIFRFKFDEGVVEKIHRFSKVHQFDDRKEYRENWEKWLVDNKYMIEKEEKRMKDLGCEKDIEEKMYKAGRYYFRNKNLSAVIPTKRRKYIAISNDMLQSMDAHIKTHVFDKDYTPAFGYDNFCETHIEILTDEICNIIKLHAITGDDIAHKIKKTYKNRYYIITHK